MIFLYMEKRSLAEMEKGWNFASIFAQGINETEAETVSLKITGFIPSSKRLQCPSFLGLNR